MTNAKICLIKFENKDIINVIKALDPCKAHGYDDRSIRMLKICDSAIVKPLTTLFKNGISEGIFPDNWKKLNIFPIHKKGDKQIVDNYRPVSLLPVCGKISERLIFNSMYQFLEEHNLLSIHQSGFRSNDSVSTRFYLLSIPCTKLLMLTLLLMQEVFFWICPRPLTKFGMKG